MSRFIIACAGSGKTTHLVSRALAERRERRTLILTYTNQNRSIIERMMYESNGCIPSGVVVDTWYSWLLHDGIKPYSRILFPNAITGLNAPQDDEGGSQRNHYLQETNPLFYMTSSGRVHHDRAAKFSVRIDEASSGKVMKRLKGIYDAIFIDEMQDLAGYDLDFIGRLCLAGINIEMAGDPRQSTLITHHEARNKKYRGKNIIKFFSDHFSKQVEVDESTLTVSHRCGEAICAEASRIFADEFPAMISRNQVLTGHDGIFFITPNEVEDYLKRHQAMQVRYNVASRHILASYPVMNIGISKGATFPRVLLFLTEDMVKWMRGDPVELKEKTKANLYVALTRAMHSVAIVDGGPKGKSGTKKRL